MKPFEIPYNFDTKLIDFLNIYNNIGIHSIYLPPFQNHYITTRHYYQYLSMTFPKNLENYEYHINYINKYFPNKIMLLLQRRDHILSDELIKYYLDLGITIFCVGTIEQARKIKQQNSQVEIIGSITLQINLQLLQQEEYNIFDGFVLFFPFNRDISLIKKLPPNFTYSLLVNSGCNIKCDGITHWFVNSQQEEQNIKNKCPGRNVNFENSIYIPNIDVQYFEPYINYIKLQGREYNTQKIIGDIVNYTYFDRINQTQIKRNYNPQILYNII